VGAWKQLQYLLEMYHVRCNILYCLLYLVNSNYNFTFFCRTSMMDWIFHSMRMFNIRLEYFPWNFPLMDGNLLLAAMMNQYMSMTFMQTNWHYVYLLIQYENCLLSCLYFLWFSFDLVPLSQKGCNSSFLPSQSISTLTKYVPKKNYLWYLIIMIHHEVYFHTYLES